MPASAKLVFAALLAASILRAFFGEPPTSAHRGGAVRAGMVGGACYLAAVGCAYAHEATVASGLIVAAVEALCLAVWLYRGHDDGFSDGDEALEPDPPVDWAEFDRVRRSWERPRPRVPV